MRHHLTPAYPVIVWIGVLLVLGGAMTALLDVVAEIAINRSNAPFRIVLAASGVTCVGAVIFMIGLVGWAWVLGVVGFFCAWGFGARYWVKHRT